LCSVLFAPAAFASGVVPVLDHVLTILLKKHAEGNQRRSMEDPGRHGGVAGLVVYVLIDLLPNERKVRAVRAKETEKKKK
jgi:hypothetical protein